MAFLARLRGVGTVRNTNTASMPKRPGMACYNNHYNNNNPPAFFSQETLQFRLEIPYVTFSYRFFF